jgi:hypothetical protein
MILPNKLINFNESILSKLVYILDVLSSEKCKPIRELYIVVKDKFEDINQYIIALDVLFALQKINYNIEMKVIEYVEADLL